MRCEWGKTARALTAVLSLVVGMWALSAWAADNDAGEATPPPDATPAPAEEPETPDADKTRIFAVGEEVVVTGTRTAHALSDAPVATSVVPQEEIQKSGAVDAANALQNVPGVYVDRWEIAGRGGPGAGINLQGLPTDRVLVLLDGQRMPMTMRAPDLELVPAPLIKRIEVVKGPSSSLYGSDAMGGVINIITRDQSKDPAAELDLEGGSFNTYGGNAFHSWSAGPVGWVANFNREQSGGWIDAYANRPVVRIGEGIVATSLVPNDPGHPYEANDAFGKVRVQTGPYVTWTGESRYHWEDNQFTDQDQGAVSDNKIQLSGMLRGELQYGRFGLTAAAGYFHRYFRYREQSTTYTINPLPPPDLIRGVVDKGNDTAGDEYTGELLASGALADWNLLTGGVSWRHDTIDYAAFELSSLTDSDQAYTAYQTVLSAFAQDEIYLFDQVWSLVPGVRVDHHPLWGATVNPKLSTLIKLPFKHNLRASIGRAFREPTLSELYRPVFRHSGYFLRGNEDLKPETAWGWNAEIEQLLGKVVHATGGYFQYELNDMIYPKIVEDNFSGGFPLMTYVNLKRARVVGASGQLYFFPIDFVTFALNYTWAKTFDLDEDRTLGTVPEHDAGARLFVDYDPWGLGGYVSGEYQSQRDYIGMGGRWYTADARWLTAARAYKTLTKHVELGARVENWLGQKWDKERDSDNDMPPTSYFGELKLAL